MQTDCLSDIGSQPFQALISELNQQPDLFSLPDKCNATTGGDLFAYSGALSCDGSVQEFTDELICLPSTCTSNSTMLPTIMGELGLFTENDSCSISTDLTFDGIGEGIPASLQCDLDFYNFLSLDADLPAYFVAKTFTGDPDYSMLPALCENDGYDFFTYDATATCYGASSYTGGSYCLPESCTGNEQLVASKVNNDPFALEPLCEPLSNFTFTGLGETIKDDFNSTAAVIECMNDLMGPEYYETLGSIYNLTEQDIVQFGNACEEIGFDMFIFDGTVTCNGVVEYKELNGPVCLPNPCTVDETFLKVLLVDDPTMITSDQCTNDFTFEHIGPGIEYDTDLLCLNTFYITTDPESHELYIVAKENAKNAAEADGESPDFSSLPALCAGIDGYDYVTYSATRTCNGELDPEIVLNEPACLPLLCRGADEAIGQILLNDLTDDEDEEFTCMLSDVNIVGFEPSTKTGKAGKKGKNTKAPKATKAPKNPKRRLTNIVNLTSYAQRQVKGRNAHFRFKFWESPK